jgi:hypothetical protein
MSNSYCEIPLATLQDSGFTNLQQGDLIVATVTATNAFGTSTVSAVNTAGALIETVPHQHASAPTRGSLTYETQIHLEYAVLTGGETGGSTITSYVVLWD